jgi:hypothetical protein
MKRLFIYKYILLALLLSLILSACSFSPAAPAETAAPTPSVPVTPSPTPTPAPVVAVFGAEASALFREGISSSAAGGAYAVEFVPGGAPALASYRPKGETAAIFYMDQPGEAMPSTDIPMFLYATKGQNIPYGTPHLRYNFYNAPQIALDCAIAYPPHLPPVRMIGLFTDHTSRAYTLWSKAGADGTVFIKREFFSLESEETLADWMTDVFARYFPGMLDAVFAETGELAVTAADKLASLGRTDVEVFSAGTDADADKSLSPILICAVGANQEIAGELCYEAAAKLLGGGAPESAVLVPEALWYSSGP